MNTYELSEIERHERNWLQATDLLAPLFSTCERRQFLAVVLAPNKRVCGIGYNGGPSGMTHCDEGGCPHSRDGQPSGGSYETCIAQHAETGALLWSDPGLRLGGTLIVNGVPCFHCAKQIASSGLSRVVFWSEPGYPSEDHTLEFLTEAGLQVFPVRKPEPVSHFIHLPVSLTPEQIESVRQQFRDAQTDHTLTYLERTVSIPQGDR